MPINIADTFENSDTVKHTIKTDLGDINIDVKEDEKEGYNLVVKHANHICSFVVGSSGDVRNGTVKGNCSDVLNVILQHLFSGASLKMK